MNLIKDFHQLWGFHALLSLLVLSVLEIVLGIDNIIFISIVSGKLPREKQFGARTRGLLLALVMRIILLFSIAWLAHITTVLFEVKDFAVSLRDVILFAGGIFLLWKTTIEIHRKIEGKDEDDTDTNKAGNAVQAVILQIVLVDILFSFDSILTAVGLVRNVLIMILAVIVGMIIMIKFSGSVSDFINKHPTVNMLALAFLLMIGLLLVLDAFHYDVPREYVYFALAFSFLVELLNMRMRKKKKKREEG